MPRGISKRQLEHLVVQLIVIINPKHNTDLYNYYAKH